MVDPSLYMSLRSVYPDQDELAWSALADLLEEHGQIQQADIWRKRRELFTILYNAYSEVKLGDKAVRREGGGIIVQLRKTRKLVTGVVYTTDEHARMGPFIVVKWSLTRSIRTALLDAVDEVLRVQGHEVSPV